MKGIEKKFSMPIMITAVNKPIPPTAIVNMLTFVLNISLELQCGQITCQRRKINLERGNTFLQLGHIFLFIQLITFIHKIRLL